MSYAKLLGLTFSCVSFAMNIIALVGTYWLRDNASEFLHEGIWQQCMNNTCLLINGKEYIDVTRTFILLSSIVLQFVMVTSCLALFNCHIGRFTASFVSFILNSISAIFLFIALVVYTLEEHLDASSSSARYGWAYFLCWTSVLFSCVADDCRYPVDIAFVGPVITLMEVVAGAAGNVQHLRSTGPTDQYQQLAMKLCKKGKRGKKATT